MASRIRKLWYNYGGLPVLIGAVSLLIGVFCVAAYYSSVGVAKVVTSIENPTERGAAYITIAIVIHAFFGRSTVEVKKD